jgi:hypothetical protein
MRCEYVYPLSTQTHYAVKISIHHHAQILLKIKLWLTQSDQRLTLQRNNIFISMIFVGICG